MSLVDLFPNRATLQLLAGAIVALFTLSSVLKYRKVLRSIGYHPGVRLPFGGTGILSRILPPIPGLSLGTTWSMDWKHKLYAQHGWDIITWVSIFPRIDVRCFVADPLAVKEIVANHARFPKPVENYGILSQFGSNIVTTEGEEWRRQRKVAAPTFSEKNNELVWAETIRIVQEIFESWGPDSSEAVVDHCLDMTVGLALLVISSAGFGRRIPWVDDGIVPSGHKLSFKETMHITTKYLYIPLIFPQWTYRFSTFLKRVELGFEEFNAYMREMVDERRTSQAERYDLFSALLEESDSNKTDGKLTEREIIGNIFIFLVAGHETTANTLCFLFGVLAIEQEEQEKLYQEILAALPNREIPTYKQFGALSYVMAVFNETLRLFPPVSGVPKYPVEDTVLPCVRPDGSIGSIPIQKGTKLMLHNHGLHYNPRYWEDPYAFNPSRFLGKWNRDAFIPFSLGPRACIGRAFSETEAVAAITTVVQNYKIELKNPELYAGLTPLEKRNKLLAHRQSLTMKPISVPLVFIKRS